MSCCLSSDCQVLYGDARVHSSNGSHWAQQRHTPLCRCNKQHVTPTCSHHSQCSPHVVHLMLAAANYRDGRSEVAIGRALSALLVGSAADMFPEGRAEVTRDMLFISSKAGFLNTGELLDKRLQQGTCRLLTSAFVHAQARGCASTRVQSLALLTHHVLAAFHSLLPAQLRDVNHFSLCRPEAAHS